MIRLSSLVVACALASVARAGERALTLDGPECGPLLKPPAYLRSVLPRHWSELGPTQQGVLIVASSPWGTYVDEGGPLYLFVSGADAPYTPYLWTDGPQPERQITGADASRVGAVALRPSTPNPFGLSRPAHLVEVKVNGGHGDPAQRQFVVSDVKHFDDTAVFPWRLPDVLDELHARYTACLEKPQFHLGEAMKKAAERFEHSKASRPPEGAGVKPAPGSGGEQSADRVYVTWDEPTQTLVVVFTTLRGRSRCWHANQWVQPPGCPPGAPCLPGHEETLTACAGFEIRSGYELEVDAKRGARPISFMPPTYIEGTAIFPKEGVDGRPLRRRR